MEAKQVDAVEFRAGQRQQWDSAAAGWRKWSEVIERGASGVSQRLVELAGVEAGSRVLDIAAGYGEPSLTAARVVGAQGGVVATDISAEMLTLAKNRAAAAGLDNIEFVESDAGSLQFPESSFDAALSRWGIIFEPDGEAVARRVRDFLKPGGRFAISSWERRSRCRCSGFQCEPRWSAFRWPRRHRGRPGRSHALRRRRWAACSRRPASPT